MGEPPGELIINATAGHFLSEKSAGLKAGDIVSQINGLDLTDIRQSQNALSELRTAQTIELTLIRDGSLTTLYLDLPEPSVE